MSPDELRFALQEIKRNSQQAGLYLQILRSLEDQRTIDALCKIAVEETETFPLAQKIAVEKNYAPVSPYERVLFYYATEQWDKLDNTLEPNQLALSIALNTASPALRKRLLKSQRKLGRADLAKAALAKNVPVAPNEQELVIKELAKLGKWAELWHLAQESSPLIAAKIVRRLTTTDWRPLETGEAKIFRRLSKLARACLYTPPFGRLTQRHTRFCLPKANFGAGHSEKITPDGTFLVVTHGQTVEFYNTLTGKLEFSLAGVPSEELFIPWQDLRFSPDGRYLVYQAISHYSVTPTQYLLQVLDIQARQVVAIIDDFENPYRDFVTPVVWLSANELLIYGKRRDQKKSYWIYDLTAEAISKKLENSLPQSIQNLALSPNRLFLAGRGTLDNLWVWSIPDREFVIMLPEATANSLHSLEFSPDSAILAYGTPEGAVLLDLAVGKRRELTLNRYKRPTALRFSPDGQVLAVGYFEANVIVLWHVQEARPLQTLKWLDDIAVDLAFSPDGTRLLSLSRKLQTQVWRSPLQNICRQLPEKSSATDLNWLQKRKHDTALAHGEERAWLKFCEALLVWRWRHAILIDEVVFTNAAPTDIELEG